MIEKQRIEAIKTGVDLKALVEAKGIQLKKNGKGWFGFCPFHADKNPSLSINPDKNLWQCFGCGAAGDVIRFVELFDQVSFTEAVGRLSVNGDRLSKTGHRSSVISDRGKYDKAKSLSVKDRKLLARVAG